VLDHLIERQHGWGDVRPAFRARRRQLHRRRQVNVANVGGGARHAAELARDPGGEHPDPADADDQRSSPAPSLPVATRWWAIDIGWLRAAASPPRPWAEASSQECSATTQYSASPPLS
jgi:hypothetical protein